MKDKDAIDALREIQPIVTSRHDDAIEIAVQSIEASARLNGNLAAAKTPSEILESFYAVTNFAEQNRAIADAVKALETVAKIRAQWAVIRSASLSDDVQVNCLAIDELLEGK